MAVSRQALVIVLALAIYGILVALVSLFWAVAAALSHQWLWAATLGSLSVLLTYAAAWLMYEVNG